MSPSRRVFLQQTSLLTASSVIFPLLSESARDPLSSARPLRFGVIADVHKDVMHDADQRLAAFVERATEAKVDFIIQMGDFCVPKVANQGFMDIWRRWKGPNYHVIGNHDTDGGYSREQTVAYYDMPSRYYSFEEGDFHFVVLDGNDRPADHVSGYPCYINAEQQAWLKEDLSATTRPTLVMVHQSLERPEDGGVQNGEAIRRILEEAAAVAAKAVAAARRQWEDEEEARRTSAVNAATCSAADSTKAAVLRWAADERERAVRAAVASTRSASEGAANVKEEAAAAAVARVQGRASVERQLLRSELETAEQEASGHRVDRRVRAPGRAHADRPRLPRDGAGGARAARPARRRVRPRRCGGLRGRLCAIPSGRPAGPERVRLARRLSCCGRQPAVPMTPDARRRPGRTVRDSFLGVCV